MRLSEGLGKLTGEATAATFLFFGETFSPEMLRAVLGDWSLWPRRAWTAIVARKCVMVVEQCRTLQPRCT